MSFLELISKKKEWIEDCEEQIDILKKEYQNEFYQEDRDRLIASLEEKKRLLNSLNGKEDLKEFNKKLDTLNEKIYRQYYILRKSIENFLEKIEIDNKSFIKDFVKKLDKGFENFDLYISYKDFLDYIKKFIPFSINNPLISVFVLYILGGGLFICYFYFHLEYFPNISKENFLYYSLAIILSTFFIVFILGLIIAIISLSFKQAFRHENKPIFIVFQCLFLIFPTTLLLNLDELNNFRYFNVGISICAVIWFRIYIFLSAEQKRINLTLRGFIINMLETIFPLVSVLCILSPVFYIQPYLSSESHWITLMFLIFFIVMAVIIKHNPSLILFLSVVGSLLITIFYLTPSVINFAGLGNYTVETLIVDSKAYIPQELSDLEQDSGNFIIKKPKILSNVGEDYLVELKDKNDKLHRFTIPKNLVKSQVITIPNQDEKQSDKPDKKLNPSFISPYPYVKPI